MSSEHSRTAIAAMPDYVSAQPDIVSVGDVPGEGWSKTGEVRPR